jgi:GNAT superfamily N-acetyltransferase
MAVRLTSSSFTADSLYEMNRDAMREHIEAARGESWNEDREAKQFHLQLRKDYVEAIERDGSAIGFIDLRRERIHLFLHTMVVLSHVQGQGTGGIVLEQIKERAQNLTKGVRLSVLTANPPDDSTSAPGSSRSHRQHLTISYRGITGCEIRALR